MVRGSDCRRHDGEWRPPRTADVTLAHQLWYSKSAKSTAVRATDAYMICMRKASSWYTSCELHVRPAQPTTSPMPPIASTMPNHHSLVFQSCASAARVMRPNTTMKTMPAAASGAQRQTKSQRAGSSGDGKLERTEMRHIAVDWRSLCE